jgi:predicted glycoside hydrolase/deacetylase ChbG (UPF0249 family)
MKSLIVNGDDFGSSHGVNHGIIVAHEQGVLTSTSMMVDLPASLEAAQLGADHPSLGIGLHVVLESPGDAPPREEEVKRQLDRFIELTGHLPTHIDTHHNVHRDPRVLPALLAVSEQHSLPLRGHCGVRHISTFYGQWDGETHLESVSPAALARIVATDVEDGFNELCCHPGYVNGELASSYLLERRAELDTLCDPATAALLREQEISLVTFREVPMR